MTRSVICGDPGHRAWLTLWLCVLSACVGAPEPEVETTPPAIALAAGPCAIEPLEAHSFDLPVWDLAIAMSDWDRLHEDVHAELEVPASVCIGGQGYAVELELQGSSTRRLPKKSFDLKFTYAQPLTEWPYADLQPGAAQPSSKLLLKAMAKDQTVAREALAFDLYRALGYAAPRTGFVNLRINGRYWGLYAVVEPVNAAFLTSRKLPTPGRLYKGVRKHGSFADFAPSRDLKRAFELHTVDAALPTPISIEPEPEPEPDTETNRALTDETSAAVSDAPIAAPAYADLEQLIRVLQTTPLDPTSFERNIDPIFPLAAYLDRMLWVAFTQNGDAVAQNFYLYRSLQPGAARWTQLPWDSDISFGADWRDPEAWLTADVALLLDGGNFFSGRLLQIPALKARYRERFLSVLRDGTLARIGFERVAHYRALIARDLTLDAERWQRDTEPDAAFAGLSDFISARSSALRDALQQL